jgi:hypothetical protein
MIFCAMATSRSLNGLNFCADTTVPMTSPQSTGSNVTLMDDPTGMTNGPAICDAAAMSSTMTLTIRTALDVDPRLV